MQNVVKSMVRWAMMLITMVAFSGCYGSLEDVEKEETKVVDLSKQQEILLEVQEVGVPRLINGEQYGFDALGLKVNAKPTNRDGQRWLEFHCGDVENNGKLGVLISRYKAGRYYLSRPENLGFCAFSNCLTSLPEKGDQIKVILNKISTSELPACPGAPTFKVKTE